VVGVAVSLLGRNAWCSHVVVLQPLAENTEGWHASTHAMIAELALAGFTVSVQHLEPNAELLETLPRVANRVGVIAAVSVTRRGDVSVGYLWLKQADAVVVVEERANQAVVAHSVVVLKLTELLREHQLDLPSPDGAELPLSEPRSSKLQSLEQQSSEPPPRESTIETGASSVPPDGEVVLRSWFGAGVDTLGLTRAHAWQLGASAELQLSKRFSLTAGVTLPLSPHESNSELGRAEVRATGVGGGALFGVFDASRVSVVFGPHVGLRFLEADADPSDEHAAQRAFARVLTLGADMRGVYRLASAVNLGVLIRGLWLTPEPRLTSDSGDVATLGAVAWSGQFLIGWELGL
jgi:hypothetical protein